jgi:hypothetical protein
MSNTADSILAQLRIVDAERHRRSSVPGLHAKVVALKAYQQRRFTHTYTDLLETPRYGAAARFFLDELYGPSDFTQRDAQFARVVPALVRMFPGDIVETVATLAELHALSESLDSAMAAELVDQQPLTGLAYIAAWQRTGRAADRQGQITLTLRIAQRLDRQTRKPLMRNGLRLMRGAARAAGLAELQRFLEAGFDTFRAMNGAREFMDIVSTREHALASALFGASADVRYGSLAMDRALTSLPPAEDAP